MEPNTTDARIEQTSDVIMNQDGSMYEGQVLKGTHIPHGIGVIRFADRSLYEGTFVEGQI